MSRIYNQEINSRDWLHQWREEQRIKRARLKEAREQKASQPPKPLGQREREEAAGRLRTPEEGGRASLSWRSWCHGQEAAAAQEYPGSRRGGMPCLLPPQSSTSQESVDPGAWGCSEGESAPLRYEVEWGKGKKRMWTQTTATPAWHVCSLP